MVKMALLVWVSTAGPQPTIDPVTLQYCDVTWLSKSRLIFMRSDGIQISPIYYRFDRINEQIIK